MLIRTKTKSEATTEGFTKPTPKPPRIRAGLEVRSTVRAGKIASVVVELYVE